MTAEDADNVIHLEYRDFEIAINAIASSIDDAAALKNALQRFLSSPKVVSSLTGPQIERLLTLFPVDLALSTPQAPAARPGALVRTGGRSDPSNFWNFMTCLFYDCYRHGDGRELPCQSRRP
jgi:hypothetical protein